MQASTATIHATRDFDLDVEMLWAHWTSPETRQRWEAGTDTGMTYDAFDTRTGGVETVRIVHEGAEIGHMTQHHHRVEPTHLLASSTTGTFGGVTTMLMTLVIEFEATETGSRLNAVSQVTDLTGRDVQAEHEKGWTWILNRFQADIDEFGPITNPKDTP
ncbi:MAG: SRPBCC domain-containing protein [Rhodobacter sp.]|nr:SRPBCC domain-containing protein [Rhodobacter sp.]